MDITVYLPDETGRWAKDNGLNLSAMLRAAVVNERERQEAIASSLENAGVHELFVDDGDERYTVRLHGSLVGRSFDRDICVYLTEDQRLFMYEDVKLDEITDSDDLREAINDDSLYREVARAIGQDPVIDIGAAS